MNRAALVQRPSRQRSAVTNGSVVLSGVDGNSALGRRYRDLVHDLSAEVGGADDEIARLQVRNAAALQLHVEDLTAKLARGEAVDPEAFTRAANAASRALNAIGRTKAARKPERPSLADYLAAKRSDAAA